MATIIDYRKYLKNKPDFYELERLGIYYVKYETELHRKNWLIGLFHGLSHKELTDKKIQDKEIDASKLTLQQMNGHRSWVTKKSKRLVIRLLFLRYVFDENMSRSRANSELLEEFGNMHSQDFGKSTIRKHTQTNRPLPSEKNS